MGKLPAEVEPLTPPVDQQLTSALTGTGGITMC